MLADNRGGSVQEEPLAAQTLEKTQGEPRLEYVGRRRQEKPAGVKLGTMHNGERSTPLLAVRLAEESRETVSQRLASSLPTVRYHAKRYLEGDGKFVNDVGVKTDTGNTQEEPLVLYGGWLAVGPHCAAQGNATRLPARK